MRREHELIDPPELAPPRGFSHVVAAAPGRTVHIAGQTAHGRDGRIEATSLTDQFAAAVRNLRTALEAAGAGPEDLVALQVYVTDVAAYRAQLTLIGAVWREVLGERYPAVSLFGVTELFDPEASVELVATAVIPEARS